MFSADWVFQAVSPGLRDSGSVWWYRGQQDTSRFTSTTSSSGFTACCVSGGVESPPSLSVKLFKASHSHGGSSDMCRYTEVETPATPADVMLWDTRPVWRTQSPQTHLRVQTLIQLFGLLIYIEETQLVRIIPKHSCKTLHKVLLIFALVLVFGSKIRDASTWFIRGSSGTRRRCDLHLFDQLLN